ncbi:MAG: hypothetical protein JSW63_04140 [Ignavibacterium sp.]|nr:MAG: hypothetical protein JSW63_04140 [Ignavibacterium sp.]
MPKTKWVKKKFEFDLSQDEFSSILNRLKETPEKIEQLIYSMSPDILTKKIDDSWSIQEHIGHIIDLEELHEGRIDDFINKAEQLRAADMTNKKNSRSRSQSKRNYKTIAGIKNYKGKINKSV